MPSSTINRNSASGTSRSSLSRTQHSFNVGDKVQVATDIARLKEMQEGHGGWNPKMAEVSPKRSTRICTKLLIHLMTNDLFVYSLLEKSEQFTA